MTRCCYTRAFLIERESFHNKIISMAFFYKAVKSITIKLLYLLKIWLAKLKKLMRIQILLQKKRINILSFSWVVLCIRRNHYLEIKYKNIKKFIPIFIWLIYLWTIIIIIVIIVAITFVSVVVLENFEKLV